MGSADGLKVMFLKARRGPGSFKPRVEGVVHKGRDLRQCAVADGHQQWLLLQADGAQVA